MASQFSIFAPSGIRFTRRTPHSERIYDGLRESWGSLFTDDPEAVVNVRAFAQAKCLGAAKEQLERAGNQANPRHVNDLLPKLETDYRLSPGPTDTIQERRAALSAAKVAARGATIDAIEAGIRSLVGDAFVAAVPQLMGDVGTGGMFPDTLSPDGNPGNFVKLSDKFKVVQLTTHTLGTWIGYMRIAGETDPLLAGEKLCVGPSDTGSTETVIITEATVTQFRATFTNPHGPGTNCTTAAIPYWISGRRFVYLSFLESFFTDAVLMQRVHAFMTKVAGHALQWAFVHDADGTGVFVIGESLLGQASIAGLT